MSETNFRDITAANCKSTLVVEELFPAGIELEMYSADQAASQDNVQMAETRQGVDGKLVGGWQPSIKTVTIMLEASSPSTKYLNQLVDAQEANQKLYSCNLICEIPSIGTVYRFLNGVLQTATMMPAQKKVLDPTTWTFQFERVERSQL
jgi:hypothetical protein